jgi:Spy/CpxP family protein refolding chaperone
MTKLTGLALMAVAAFAVTSAYAGDKDKDGGCCATHAKNAKMDCSQTYAKLNLSAEQKTKMDALVTKCNKNGCTKESMEAFMKSAEGVLSKEQMATLKTECSKMHDKGSKA